MDSDRLAKAKRLFEKLVELPADERERLLAEASEADSNLRHYVKELLTDQDRGLGSFLEPRSKPPGQHSAIPNSVEISDEKLPGGGGVSPTTTDPAPINRPRPEPPVSRGARTPS
jgi:hypothetical protein